MASTVTDACWCRVEEGQAESDGRLAIVRCLAAKRGERDNEGRAEFGEGKRKERVGEGKGGRKGSPGDGQHAPSGSGGLAAAVLAKRLTRGDFHPSPRCRPVVGKLEWSRQTQPAETQVKLTASSSVGHTGTASEPGAVGTLGWVVAARRQLASQVPGSIGASDGLRSGSTDTVLAAAGRTNRERTRRGARERLWFLLELDLPKRAVRCWLRRGKRLPSGAG